MLGWDCVVSFATEFDPKIRSSRLIPSTRIKKNTLKLQINGNIDDF